MRNELTHHIYQAYTLVTHTWFVYIWINSEMCTVVRSLNTCLYDEVKQGVNLHETHPLFALT